MIFHHQSDTRKHKWTPSLSTMHSNWNVSEPLCLTLDASYPGIRMEVCIWPHAIGLTALLKHVRWRLARDESKHVYSSNSAKTTRRRCKIMKCLFNDDMLRQHSPAIWTMSWVISLGRLCRHTVIMTVLLFSPVGQNWQWRGSNMCVATSAPKEHPSIRLWANVP
jgi:hypothetical protein